MKHSHRSHAGLRRSSQRGVVLLFSLIALVILLIASVALVRSFNTSMFAAGNIAFKRDLQNQGERVVDLALSNFRTGGTLNTAAARAANDATKNYSAQMLATNSKGIPSMLATNDFAAYNAASYSAVTDTTQGVTMRYVIERLCGTTGNETSLGEGQCVLSQSPKPPQTQRRDLMSAESNPLGAGLSSASPQLVVYRVTVRVDGPRQTLSFFQSTFTAP